MQDNLEILPVTSNDIPALGDMLLRSKLTLTINRLLWKDWPNEAAQRPQYTATVQDSFNDSNMEKFKVLDHSTQQIVGYMVLARKKPVDSSSSEGQKPNVGQMPDAMNRNVGDAVYKAIAHISAKWEVEDRYELVFIVVELPYRRQGIGSALMKICFERAQKASLPLVLYSEPAAHKFFKKLGFHDVTHADMDLAQWAPEYTGFGMFRLTGMEQRS